ncbi:unknown protein [Xanthomonas oryzae pv. oryzae KACC 10331]|uniref:Uncharacterized protein n=1 Tax=Xanthomonas oryzae pv. oryzae (strain KACC10331 / KXO85) TaxID=291331 RepID=Q5GZY9_XANOR|nr:unknown protein [Xanthomonas oryzae pv. oryzae KACC 10331]
MFHLRPQAGLGVLPALGQLQFAFVLDLLQLRGFLGDQVAQRALALHLLALLKPGVAAVPAHRILLAVQQLVRLRDIGHVGRRAFDVVHQPGVIVHPDVRLHPEVILIPLLGLVHVRIALALLVLGRTGRRNDRGIHDRPAPQTLPFTRQVRVDPVEQLARQIMPLQQMPEVENRRFIRHLVQPADLREAAHRHRVVQRFFRRGIAQRIPLLQKVDAQHRLQPIRLSPRLPRLWIVRLDQRQQALPWHDLIHLGQEHLTPRPLALAVVLRVSEGQLHCRRPVASVRLSQDQGEVFRVSLNAVLHLVSAIRRRQGISSSQ